MNDRAGCALAWPYEFDGPGGAPPDPGTWRPETGGHGWGNAELQYYTGGTFPQRMLVDYVRVYAGPAAAG